MPEGETGRDGPLAGLRIVEFAGIGPGPMAAMLLADLGANVIRLDRTTPSGLGIDKPRRFDLLLRGRSSLAVNLKTREGVEFALRLLDVADACIEGFRPGTMERLGLGPDVALARNPSLVYGRMTGFGQTGTLAQAAGHDLNYIALSGALAAIGRKGGKPAPPLNLVGDFGGGSLYLAVGMLAALVERGASGKGQVVDAAVVDGATHLMTAAYGSYAAGMHSLERGTNILDSGSPIYDVYECSDGHYISIAPIELKFRRELFDLIGLDAAMDAPDLPPRLEAIFRTKTRDEWCSLLEGTDACFAPVLDMSETPGHPHNAARRTLVEIDGVVQPAPAPRFSRSATTTPSPPEGVSDDVSGLLGRWGLSDEQIADIQTPGH